jgi:hypothetical protein
MIIFSHTRHTLPIVIDNVPYRSLIPVGKLLQAECRGKPATAYLRLASEERSSPANAMRRTIP